MSLNEVLKKIALEEKGQIPLLPVFTSHKEYQSGGIFVAVRGNSFDGHSVLASLMNPKGLILEDKSKLPASYEGPYIVVSSSRKAVDLIFHYLNQFPSKKLICIGITGTNGKTTTSHMVEFLLNQNLIPTGVIGTIDHHFKNKIWKTHLTTPGSQEFYERLYQFVSLGAKALSVEVSSHALDQDRMSSTEFDIAVFTNLTRDHLDYHGTFEHYFHSKQKLFKELMEQSSKSNKCAVINVDDEYGKKIVVAPGVRVIRYGLYDGDLRAEIKTQSFSGQELNVFFDGKTIACRIPLVGAFNVYNYLSTLGVAIALGLDLSKVLKQFELFSGVRGRMEYVPNSHQKYAFVDYAHTPDALEKALQTLVPLKQKNKIITVVGCGGDRDQGKRPLMGEIACRLSDFVIFTSDNPRTEYPGQILEDIAKGCAGYSHFSLEVDRKKAIEKALLMAQPGDAILVAGKGHEDYQIIGKTSHPFSDFEIIRNALK